MKKFLQQIEDTRIRQGLIYSVRDGILWAIMYGMAESYLVPFALLFDATPFQISLIQGGAFLGVTIGQLTGAKLTFHVSSRKALIVAAVRAVRAAWLLILTFALLTKNPWFVVLFYFLGITAGNLGSPAWLSWMNDVIPRHLRGEFWGHRNIRMGVTQFVSMALAGVALHFSEGSPLIFTVFGVLFALAFLSRFMGSFCVKRQYEPPMKITSSTGAFRFHIFLTKLLPTNFGRFALFNFCMAFAINIMIPIINVYMLKALKFSYGQFTAMNIALMVMSFLSMTYWGPLSDRYGNYRILIVTTMSLPLVALGWIACKNFYILFALQCFNGFVMAGMNLAMVNYIFDAVEPQNVAKISAYFNTLNNLFAFSGALIGGSLTKITPHVSLDIFSPENYELIFLLSAVIRLLVIILFWKRFREVRQVEPAPSLHYFYVYKPMTSIINRFQVFNGRRQETDSVADA